MKSAVSSLCFTFFPHWKVTTSCCSDSNCRIIYVIRFVSKRRSEFRFTVWMSSSYESVSSEHSMESCEYFFDRNSVFDSFINFLTLSNVEYETCMLIRSIHMSQHLTIVWDYSRHQVPRRVWLRRLIKASSPRASFRPLESYYSDS
jgi:hypothetical protein